MERHKQLNYSAIACAAIRNAINYEDRIMDEPALLERLSVEREQYESETELMGREDFAKDAANFSYSDLAELADLDFQDIPEGWERDDYIPSDLPQSRERAYLRGWMQAASGLWEQTQT